MSNDVAIGVLLLFFLLLFFFLFPVEREWEGEEEAETGNVINM